MLENKINTSDKPVPNNAVTYYSYTVFFKNGKHDETVHHPNCENITGYTPEEFNLDRDLWMKMVPVSDQEFVLQQIDYALLNNENHEFEHRIQHKTRGIRWIKNIIIFNKDIAGNFISYTGLVIDITSEKAGEKALLEKAEDLLIAAAIQRAYLPRLEDFRDYKLLDIHYFYQPLFEVGGDIISINLINDNKMAVFIADVTGHGVAAAILGAVVKSVSEQARIKFPDQPAAYLRYFNEIITQKFYSSRQFLTGLYGCFEPLENNQMRFTWAKGGHPQPYLFRKKENSFSHLFSRGMLMGVSMTQEFEEKSVILKKGDRLFLYTDGISETQNNEMMVLDEERDWKAIFVNSDNDPINKSINKILSRLNAMRTGPIEDDIILAGFEVR